MLQHRIIKALDPAEAAAIFACPPLRSSHSFNWRDIYLEHHYQPAYETPEYCYRWHVVGIHIGNPVAVDMQSEHQAFGRKFVRDGDVYLFPAHSRQRMRCHQTSEFVDLHLSPDLLQRLAYDLIEVEKIQFQPRFAVRDPLIQQLCLTLKLELESVHSASPLAVDRLYAESIAQTLAIHLLRRYANHSKIDQINQTGLAPALLQQVVEYINDQLEQDLSVEAIAALVQLSPFHFSRLFKQGMGLSPYQYILQCRIERSKLLLRQRHFSIAEVAHQVGFASQSHLHRHFKRIVGVTPKQFRRSWQE